VLPRATRSLPHDCPNERWHLVVGVGRLALGVGPECALVAFSHALKHVRRRYGPSSAIVCNGSGECWHSVQRYDYPQNVQVEVHPYNWPHGGGLWPRAGYPGVPWRRLPNGGWGGWARPGWYHWAPGGAIAAGAALGLLATGAAIAYAGQPLAPGLCWYYTDPSYRNGFWDACQ
jgi:hypothetical protein